MAEKYGTSHFKSKRAACSYYKRYIYLYYTAAEVARVIEQKLNLNEIAIGPPRGRRGWDLSIDNDGRYMFTKQEPKTKKCSTPANEIPF